MQGLVGYDEIAPLLPLLDPVIGSPADWLEARAQLVSLPAHAVSAALSAIDAEQSAPLREWLRDDCPKLPGSRYARFFWELDAWTEYWDISHPETHGRYYFGEGDSPGYLAAFLPSPKRLRDPVFDAWKSLAIYSADGPGRTLLARFQAEARRPDVVEAVLAVDELVLELVKQHFATPGGGVDTLAYLDAMERFGKDTLPECPERFERLSATDPRKSSSLHHTIERHVMWFGWAVHLEGAELVAPVDPDAQALRRLLLAGAALGAAFDFAFRGRCRTRREYVFADETAWASIWSRARQCALDFSDGANGMRALFRIREYGDG
jgi:hypothetical protein